MKLNPKVKASKNLKMESEDGPGHSAECLDIFGAGRFQQIFLKKLLEFQEER